MADYMIITSDLKPSQERNYSSFDFDIGHRLLVLGFQNNLPSCDKNL